MARRGPVKQASGWIWQVLSHKVAANILMSVALLLGGLGLWSLPMTLLPEFTVPYATVFVAWPGSASQDIESSIVTPMELALSGVADIDRVQSYSLPNRAFLLIQFDIAAKMDRAYLDVKRVVESVPLPEGAERPVTQLVQIYDPVTTLLLRGGLDDQELRSVAKEMESDLLASGVRRLEVSGVRDDRIVIRIEALKLHQHGLKMDDVVGMIRANFDADPGGRLGEEDKLVQIRGTRYAESAYALSQLPLILPSGKVLFLGEIASIDREVDANTRYLEKNGKGLLAIQASRPVGEDSMSIGLRVRKWLDQTQKTLTEGVEISAFNETWTVVYARMMLLLENALTGLALVMLILMLFLGRKVAFWVVVGIPIAVLLSVFVMWVFGRSLNIMSSFAYILALGIIVDDAIVVGEETASQMAAGKKAKLAAYFGAQRMWVPVLASSATTVAAMLPLLLISGDWGEFMLDIPLVIIAVIIASLFECFFILPGHLAHMRLVVPGRFRKWAQAVGMSILEGGFRPLVRLALRYRLVVMSVVGSILWLTVALINYGHVPFEFYTGLENDRVVVNVQFAQNASQEVKEQVMRGLEESLQKAEASLEKGLVLSHYVQYNQIQTRNFIDRLKNPYPTRYASLMVMLSPRDTRVWSNEQFIQAWRKVLPNLVKEVQNVDIKSGHSGPDQSDLRFSLRGEDQAELKEASLYLQKQLAKRLGVYNIQDDFPEGIETFSYHLKPMAEQLGLSKAFFGRQLTSLLSPKRLGYIYEDGQAVEIRVMLDDKSTGSWSGLSHLPLWINSRSTLPLNALLDLEPLKSFDVVMHDQGKIAVLVTADVNLELANARAIEREIWELDIPVLKQKYGVEVVKSRATTRQEQTLDEMSMGAIAGLVLMYLILSLVFASYSWPWAVLLVLPLGLTGAILGHWVLGLSVGLFSLFGMFTLSGIVVNDAIILLVRYRELCEEAEAGQNHRASASLPSKERMREYLVEACCQRLRPVVLTSLTTVLGLLPIMLNQSATAKFFHTTAATIIFGLLFASFWILIVIPVLLSCIEDVRYRFLTRFDTV